MHKNANFLSRNFGVQSGPTLYRTVRAPFGARALRLQPHQPHGWSGPVLDTKEYRPFGMSSEFVTENCHTAHSTTAMEMSLQLFCSWSIINLQQNTMVVPHLCYITVSLCQSLKYMLCRKYNSELATGHAFSDLAHFHTCGNVWLSSMWWPTMMVFVKKERKQNIMAWYAFAWVTITSLYSTLTEVRPCPQASHYKNLWGLQKCYFCRPDSLSDSGIQHSGKALKTSSSSSSSSQSPYGPLHTPLWPWPIQASQ